MSLIVEDGTGVANANSYSSLTDANTYFALRNDTTWDALDDTDQKTPYLILAVDYMQQAFRTRWHGWRSLSSQVLDWPRLWVPKFDAPGGYGPYPVYYGNTDIPTQLKDAQCLLAKKIVNGDLAPDLERVEKIVKVGSIQVEYDSNKPPVTIFRDVEMLLGPLFQLSGNMVRLGRT